MTFVSIAMLGKGIVVGLTLLSYGGKHVIIVVFENNELYDVYT